MSITISLDTAEMVLGELLAPGNAELLMAYIGERNRRESELSGIIRNMSGNLVRRDETINELRAQLAAYEAETPEPSPCPFNVGDWVQHCTQPGEGVALVTWAGKDEFKRTPRTGSSDEFCQQSSQNNYSFMCYRDEWHEWELVPAPEWADEVADVIAKLTADVPA
jgi:hypothetical protein